MMPDKARARRSDRVQSHKAADKSARNKKGSALGVLRLVFQEGQLGGSEINELYRRLYRKNKWPRVALDSPRKRAGELCEDGYLEGIDTQRATQLPERVFRITDAGKLLIGVTQ
jgi:hypothetical protein